MDSVLSVMKRVMAKMFPAESAERTKVLNDDARCCSVGSKEVGMIYIPEEVKLSLDA